MTSFSIGTGEQNLAENENFKNELKHILWRWLDRLNVVGDRGTSIEKAEIQ
jgi:hypothetical protein